MIIRTHQSKFEATHRAKVFLFLGRKVIVGFKPTREAIVYSLPDLAYSHSLRLSDGPSS